MQEKLEIEKNEAELMRQIEAESKQAETVPIVNEVKAIKEEDKEDGGEPVKLIGRSVAVALQIFRERKMLGVDMHTIGRNKEKSLS